MEKLSGCMELLGRVQLCPQIGHVKHQGMNFKMLKLKTECLVDVRDATKEEIIKELMQGKMPTRERQTWLKEVEEIERQVNDILKFEQKTSKLRVMNMHDKIDDLLDRSPFKHGPMVDASDETTRRMTGPRIGGEAYGRVKESKTVKLKRKAGTEAKANVDTGISSMEASVRVPKDKKKYVFDEADGKLMRLQRSEAQAVPVAGLKGKTAISEISSWHDSEIELIPSETEWSFHEAEIYGASDESEGMLSIRASEIYGATDESEGEDQMEPETEWSFHEAEIYDATDEFKEMFSIREPEIETIHSETEEEGQMKPELGMSIKMSVEPTTPLAVSKASPSNKAAVKPEMLPSFNRRDEILLINEAETETYYRTPGAGQVLPESGNVKRSIEGTVQVVLGCMRDVTARRIGIYGNGGIGKTSVLKALINYRETKSMFDLIIWVTVSRYSSTRKIQNEVIRQLSLCLDSQTECEIAEKLFQAFKNKKFLLLLDDVWEWVDLDAVGIPNPKLTNGCRIILTTRSLDVCRVMAADREIKVEAVSRDEAWKLFHDQVGGIVDSPDIQPFAQAIVECCGGLPLMIIVTGRALRKENDVLAWRHALREFLLPSTLGIHGSEAVIRQLQFSYDRLKARDIKSCFLYCTLFPEDYEVNISELIDYFINEGLVAGNLADARKKGHDIVKVLIDASLLESSDGGLSVKMHDVIRDLALGIISSEAEGCQFLVRVDSRMTQPPKLELETGKIFLGNSAISRPLESPERIKFLFPEGHQFLLRAGAGLTEPPSKEEWEQAKMIFLMDNELSSLPESPSCPHLLTLFLQRNYRLRVIPVSFFDCMPSLQVLNLSKTRIKSLPQSLSKLKSLRVLILRDCERLVNVPSEIGALKLLEVLDLKGTKINNLPYEIGELACLKHLQVSFYGSVNRSEYVKLAPELVSRGTISGLLALKDLSIVVYPGDLRWNRCVEYVTVEVGSLKELIALSFYFPEVESLKLFIQTSVSWKGDGLTKFKFVVGHDVKRLVSQVPRNVEFEYGQRDQCLRFVNGETVPAAVVEVLTHTTAFYLDHHLNIRNLSKFGVSNINALEFCLVRECPEIQTIMDGKEVSVSVFPFLEHLSIHYLWNLTTICEGPMPTGSFSRLKFLSVHTCPKLTWVLAYSMLQNLSNLEVLVVEDCPSIKEIIIKDEAIDSGAIVLPRLKKLTLHYLPELVSIWEGSWPSLEHISFYNCPNLKNLRMDSNLMNSIKEIKAQKDWWDKLKWEETALFSQLRARFTLICDDDL